MSNGLIEISNKKLEWFSVPRSNGLKLLKKYASTEVLSPKTLDDTFNNWAESEDNQKPQEIIVGYGLGVLFGDFMINEAGGKWMAADEDQDFELAVLFDNGYIAYPVDSVWKRIPKNEYELSFFEPIWRVLSEKVIT